MHRITLLVSSLALALAACSSKQQDDGSTAAANTPAAPTEVELIPRDALFGNPERAGVQISPDGKYLSWIAPLEGVMNVWVAPANDLAAARAVTDDQARGMMEWMLQGQSVMVATNKIFMAIAVLFTIAAFAIWLAPRPTRIADTSGVH